MGPFNIDYRAFLNFLLPVRKRTAVRKSWLNALIAPVIYLYSLFNTNRSNNLYYLAHNGQVVYLQAALNDMFDSVDRRIVIVDSAEVAPVYIALDVEESPQWLALDSESAPLWLATDAEILSAFNGFVVQVPSAITFGNNRMKALIDKYRLTSKNSYIIQLV